MDHVELAVDHVKLAVDHVELEHHEVLKYTIINYPRQHNNLLLLDWTTCFDQLIGHPQVLIYCEVFRELCARYWDPKCFHTRRSLYRNGFNLYANERLV